MISATADIGSRVLKEKATAENVRPLELFRCGFQYARTNKDFSRS